MRVLGNKTGSIDWNVVVMELLEMVDAGKGKVRLVFDCTEPLVLYYGEIKEFSLKAPMEIGEQLYRTLYHEVLGKRVIKRAMFLLQRMDRTEAQLRNKLAEGSYPGELIEAAISYVKAYHYVDDARYAENYIRTYKESKSHGRLRRDLLQKGIEDSLIELALEENDADQSEMIQRLLEKRHYFPETATQKDKQRMYRFLLGRGFSAGEIMREL